MHLAKRINQQMNASRPWIFLTLILCCKHGTTQDSIERTTKPIFVEAALLYDFPQSYGLMAGVNIPFRSLIKKTITRKDNIITKQKDAILGVSAGFYRYQYNYTGVLLTSFIGFRRYVRPSLFHETAVGIGLLRTFYDGTVYKVDAAGNVNEANDYGRFYATTSFSWAINFLLRKPGRSILAVQLKPLLWIQYPYNSFIKPHFSLAAGIKYEIAKRSVSVRTKTKNKKR